MKTGSIFAVTLAVLLAIVGGAKSVCAQNVLNNQLIYLESDIPSSGVLDLTMNFNSDQSGGTGYINGSPDPSNITLNTDPNTHKTVGYFHPKAHSNSSNNRSVYEPGFSGTGTTTTSAGYETINAKGPIDLSGVVEGTATTVSLPSPTIKLTLNPSDPAAYEIITYTSTSTPNPATPGLFNTITSYTEFPATSDGNPVVAFGDQQSLPITLSNVGFFTSPTQIPLDQLDDTSYPYASSTPLYGPGGASSFTVASGGQAVASVPEPAWLSLLAMGLGLACRHRRR
jgi:hypothetical protein